MRPSVKDMESGPVDDTAIERSVWPARRGSLKGSSGCPASLASPWRFSPSRRPGSVMSETPRSLNRPRANRPDQDHRWPAQRRLDCRVGDGLRALSRRTRRAVRSFPISHRPHGRRRLARDNARGGGRHRDRCANGGVSTNYPRGGAWSGWCAGRRARHRIGGGTRCPICPG